ncbi:type III secretion system apparatus protein [Candidatus Regiella insecticola LSR1]|uniref:Type III secretion system apparatus protein n=1 Tax=Candidatus Regiella insecticola LSR1 TaxID=663321 RepID=E0WTK4_9ENTR|nr:EscU/YscU/HrcU family type III secretion system export apparatus switch protein [Candidatus Regiella insecticola]EFL91889.1 type III secretion system apparatus protein [Candidatus Regiella insecticola LSR1]
MAEKNEKPTPKKIKDAREKGQVIKSVEITSGAQLVVVLIYFTLTGNDLIDQAAALIRSSIEQLSQPMNIAALRIGAEATALLMHITGILGGALIIITLLMGISQIGPLWAPKALSIKGERINPINNLRNLISFRSLFELGKSLIKIVSLSLIFGYLLSRYAPTFGYLSYCGSVCAMPVFGTLMSWLLGSLIACYLLFALLDYSFQRHSVMKQLKMSPEEIKREYKDSEGDPHIKQKRRELQQQIQSGSLSTNVNRSTAVVRNPTHFAVCLFYHPEEAPLPIVLEKGHHEMAKTIIKMAERAGVPVIENVALARALYRDVDCGNTIPEKLFEPVATLLRMVLAYQTDDDDDEKS